MKDRKGIIVGNILNVPHCKCEKHGKVWKEGDNFEENGGKACKQCVLNSQEGSNEQT